MSLQTSRAPQHDASVNGLAVVETVPSHRPRPCLRSVDWPQQTEARTGSARAGVETAGSPD